MERSSKEDRKKLKNLPKIQKLFFRFIMCKGWKNTEKEAF